LWIEAGFTLLEVMVAVSILAMGLIVLVDSQGGSIKMTIYAKNVTSATQLARACLVDLNEKIKSKKLDLDLSKSFEKECEFDKMGRGFERFKGKALFKKVEFAAPNGLLGTPQGEGSDGEQGGPPPGQTLLNALGMPQSSSSSSSDLTSALGPILGGMSTMMEAEFKKLQESLREVTVTVTWKEGSQELHVKVTTHMFKFNPSTGMPGPWPANTPGGQGSN